MKVAFDLFNVLGLIRKKAHFASKCNLFMGGDAINYDTYNLQNQHTDTPKKMVRLIGIY